jgi:ankyrin repeat protein
LSDKVKVGFLFLGIALVAFASARLARLVELRSHGEYAIVDAMRADSTLQLQELLYLGANPNRVMDGTTILNWAMNSEYLPTTEVKIEMLLAHGADPNFRDDGNLTAFEYNTFGLYWNSPAGISIDENPRKKIEAMFLDAGAEETIFSLTLMEKWDEARELILADPELVHQTFDDGRTLIHTAALIADDGFLKFLAEQGADMNALDNFEYTPLMTYFIPREGFNRNRQFPYASDSDRFRLLIELGADIAFETDEGRNILQFLSLQGTQPEQLDMLGDSFDLEHRDEYDFTALTYTVQSGNVSTARWMLEKGAKPVSRELHLAIARYDKNMIKLLLDHGADPNELDSQDMTPLHRIIEVMVDGDFDIESANYYTYYKDMSNFAIETMQNLLNAGADPLLDTRLHSTPRNMAKYGNCEPCLDLFDAAIAEKAE